MTKSCLFKIVIAVLVTGALAAPAAYAREGYCTWYNRASCSREGTGGKGILMANGKPLVDTALTCASWDYPLGTLVGIYCPESEQAVFATVEDRGPGRGPRRRGVIVDVTPVLFKSLCGDLRRGIIHVYVQPVKEY